MIQSSREHVFEDWDMEAVNSLAFDGIPTTLRSSPAAKSNVVLPEVWKHAGRVRNWRVVPSAQVGAPVGIRVGSGVGMPVGEVVGPLVGEVVGLPVGMVVVGLSVGASEHSTTVPQGKTPFHLKLTVPVVGSYERMMMADPTETSGISIVTSSPGPLQKMFMPL
jgi:hypothetical protein